MLASIASRPLCRLALGAVLLLWLLFAFAFLGNRYSNAGGWYSASLDRFRQWTANYTSKLDGGSTAVPISYNLDVAPTVGCEAVVDELQHRLIEAYSGLFKGIRYANIWGYLGILPLRRPPGCSN